MVTIKLEAVLRAVDWMCLRETKVLFFIDGLDEYERDHDEIAGFFSKLSATPFVKFCIYNRPLNVFKDTFGNCHSLRLQDLTCADIQRYINDKIEIDG